MPDITGLMQYKFCEPVYYQEFEVDFLTKSGNESRGRWLGRAPDSGNKMCYCKLTDDTEQIIVRSMVRPSRRFSVVAIALAILQALAGLDISPGASNAFVLIFSQSLAHLVNLLQGQSERSDRRVDCRVFCICFLSVPDLSLPTIQTERIGSGN